MRIAIKIVALLVVLLAVYTAWPLYDLYRLASAVQMRDLAALERSVDFRAVRGSVSRQIFTAYLSVVDKGRLGAIGRQLAVGAAASAAAAAAPSFDEYATPARLLELLEEGLPEARAGGEEGARGIRLVPGDVTSAWRVYASSEYRLAQYTVKIPPQVEPERRFGLQLKLIRWRWKLTGVELPESLKVKIADRMAGRAEPR